MTCYALLELLELGDQLRIPSGLTAVPRKLDVVGLASSVRRLSSASSTFGETKLRQITPERVRTWHADVTKSARADQAAKSYRLLRAIMTTAVSDSLVGRNPCVLRGAGSWASPGRRSEIGSWPTTWTASFPQQGQRKRPT